MIKPPQMDLWNGSAAKKRIVEIELLKPIALFLAKKAGLAGITIADVRLEAQRRNIIPQQATGRELSYLGAVMKAAGLVATDRVRRSTIVRSHGNRHTVWVLA